MHALCNLVYHLSKLIYFLSISRVLVEVASKIEKFHRDFLWFGFVGKPKLIWKEITL